MGYAMHNNFGNAEWKEFLEAIARELSLVFA